MGESWALQQQRIFHRGCELGPEQQKKGEKKRMKKRKKEKRGELVCFDAL